MENQQNQTVYLRHVSVLKSLAGSSDKSSFRFQTHKTLAESWSGIDGIKESNILIPNPIRNTTDTNYYYTERIRFGFGICMYVTNFMLVDSIVSVLWEEAKSFIFSANCEPSIGRIRMLILYELALICLYRTQSAKRSHFIYTWMWTTRLMKWNDSCAAVAVLCYSLWISSIL